MRNLHSLRLHLFSRTLFTIGLVTLLMIDSFAIQNNNKANTTKEITTTRTMTNSITHGKEHEDGRRHGDLSYAASKRKVPRGSDPIHNRFLPITRFIYHLQSTNLACLCVLFFSA
uniref:CLE26 n=1 Tax=Raphanus sativus TaxID=3726 RepID=A0A0X8GW50_RAPSA|nr:CLE26 [Raphanus sativus]